MTKTIIALTVAAMAMAAVTPAFAHCGGGHAKSYRAAQSKKPASKGNAAVATRTDSQPQQLTSATPQSALSGNGAAATF